MLPAAAKHRFSLADVMPSCLAALVGSHETLDLGHPSKIVVVVVDGLGTHPLLARAGQGAFDWEVIGPFTLTAVAGSLAGKKIAERVANSTLTRAFAVLLVLVAGYVAVRAGLALT